MAKLNSREKYVKANDDGKAMLMPEVTKQELYYEMKDGRGMTHRIANMKNPLVCRTKGTIRIESIYRNNNKQPNTSLCTVFDKHNRIIYGIPTSIDTRGHIVYKRFVIPEFKEYNLCNQDEAEEWAIVRHHEILTGARAEYKLYDTDAIAEAEVAKASLIEQAIGIAKAMKLKDWIPAARFFGNQPEGMSQISLQAEIMKIAKDTPDELINYWTQGNREIIDIFNAAKAVGLIHYDFAKGWLYKKSLSMGNTEESAIQYMVKDQQFAKGVQIEVKSSDVAEKNIAEGNSVRNKTSFDQINEDKDLLTLRIKAKLLEIKGFEMMETEDLRKIVSNKESIALEEESEV